LFPSSFALSEAWDVLILSATRGLLHGSEQVAPHRMICAVSQAVRGGVKPVMPRGVSRVGITGVMARHVGHSIPAVAMQVVAGVTAAVAKPAAVSAVSAAAAAAGPPPRD